MFPLQFIIGRRIMQQKLHRRIRTAAANVKSFKSLFALVNLSNFITEQTCYEDRTATVSICQKSIPKHREKVDLR